MSKLTWDDSGKRLFETGVDHGVLYIPDAGGAYSNGVSWNGLTAISESPSGADPNPMYADNVKYLNLYSIEEFGFDIEAYTYPDEFRPFDGLSVPTPGVTVAQQARSSFGLSYRTRVGNDVLGDAYGYKIHLVYGCKASPSAKGYSTINDKPDGITFKWTVSTTPVAVNGQARSSALLTIDSTKVSSTALTSLETTLYGASGVNPQLPLPDAVITTVGGSTTTITTVTVPTYVSGTHIVTIPTQVGVTYYIAGIAQAAGALPALTTGQTVLIEARANTGYVIASGQDTDWMYSY